MITVRNINFTNRLRCGAAILFCVLSVGLATNSQLSAESFVIRNARVFDGRRVIDDSDVWVEAGKIKEVGKQLKVGSDCQIVDGTGATVLPGLIDAHTHAWGDALKEAIVFGVTTELDM